MVKLSKTGFTFIELLVVIAIVTIISGMVVVNFRKGEVSGRRQRSVQQIVQNIRKIQNMALSSVEYQGEVYSYGVHFDKNEPNNREYIIFADKNDSGRYDAGDDIIGSLYNLETGVEIDDLSTITEAGGADVNVLDIVFIPPDPLTKFNNDFNIIEVEIVIKEEKTKWYLKTVRVGKAGWVSIE